MIICELFAVINKKLVSSNEIRQYYIEIGERTIIFGLNANATNGHKYNIL